MQTKMNNRLNLFSLSGFNDSVNYLQTAIMIHKYLIAGCNFSDIINALGSKVGSEHIPYLIKIFLVEKLQYKFVSFNLKREVADFSYLRKRLVNYNQVNSNIIYYNTLLGYKCLNPLRDKDWDGLTMENDSLVTLFATTKKELQDFLGRYFTKVEDIFIGAIELEDIQALIGEVSIIKSLKVAKEEILSKNIKMVPVTKQKQQVSSEESNKFITLEKTIEKKKKVKKKSKDLKMTPKYSIQVTNELFHNGNVEAWKNIIQSYSIIYPDIEVLVFHQGAKVVNLNSLFKWGKVKNGDIILFCLVGENFQSIAKLQRYLFEGASNRFNRYLKKDINKPLELF